VLVVFEYGTLNGGERSMLLVFDALRSRRAGPEAIDIVAAGPADGRLAQALSERGLPRFPLQLRDAAGRRVGRETACRQLLAAVEWAEPDVVHANSLSMGRLTGAIAARIRVPTVAHLRDILRLSAAACAELNRNRLLVAVSEATRAFHAEQGLDAARLRVIRNGVDGDEFQPRPRAGSLRDELELPPDAFLIGTIGQIGLRKGQDVLAAAAPSVAARLPHAHFVIVGERYSSKLESIRFEESILERFEAAGLARRLHRLGYRTDVARLMSELDLLVHPARQEPLGRVLLEAAAAGLPVVATAVGGTTEILTDGESARLVPPDDAPALAGAILELAGDAALRDRLARSARLRTEHEFSPNRAADALAALWHAAVKRSPNGHAGSS
jgi:glycosyltransferase involved in cell wall biosynthesis